MSELFSAMKTIICQVNGSEIKNLKPITVLSPNSDDNQSLAKSIFSGTAGHRYGDDRVKSDP